MADAITIAQLIEASEDAQSLSLFVNADAATQVPRRLADPIETLEYWRDYMGNLAAGKDGESIVFDDLTQAQKDEIKGEKGLDGSYTLKAYSTYALMTTDAANIPANTSVNVTNDTDSTKNGMYAYNGTSFTKSAYDPLTQANAYSDSKNDSLLSAIDSKIEDNKVKVLDGSAIYYQAKDEPNTLFTAIWSEHNKPVWYIGNDTVVDSVGAEVSVMKEELVFTIKLTEANQTFLYPIRNAPDPAINATVDWGDGITTTHTDYLINHTYVGSIGDIFTIKVSGNPLHFDFSGSNASRNTSRLMMRSIESNTLPKTMPYFSILGCTNMVYLGRGALSSFTGTSLAGYFLYLNSLVIHSKVFEGLSQVTNINTMFADASRSVAIAIPANVLDPLINVTTATYLFSGLSAPLPLGILDKLTNLQDVSLMFFGATVTSIDSNLFKYQTNLQNVSNTFRLTVNAVADAETLYNDMVRGNPTATTLCFNGANSMTNLASVPTSWKS